MIVIAKGLLIGLPRLRKTRRETKQKRQLSFDMCSREMSKALDGWSLRAGFERAARAEGTREHEKVEDVHDRDVRSEKRNTWSAKVEFSLDFSSVE